MKRALIAFLALAAVAACTMLRGGPPSYWQGMPSNTNYRLNPDGWRTTMTGIRLYDPKGEVDDIDVAAVVSRVETCTAIMDVPTRDQLVAGGCPVGVPWYSQGWRPDLFDVVIAPDWSRSHCTGKQLFPCGVSKADCDQAKKDKGLTGDCPCACRGTVQENKHVIVTPNLELLPGMLFSLITGCTRPWMPPFAKCTAPPELQ